MHVGRFSRRDRRGAIRFLEAGNLPFGAAIRAFHRRCLGSRTGSDLGAVVGDINYIARGGNLAADPHRPKIFGRFLASTRRSFDKCTT